MRNRELAIYLSKTPGEAMVPVQSAGGIEHVRAHKGDLILQLKAEPDDEDFEVAAVFPIEGIPRRMHQIYLRSALPDDPPEGGA